MLRCVEARPMLSFFIERETDPLQTLETRRHIDSCASCRARAEGMREVMERCSDIEEQRPPRDIAASVMDRLRGMRDAALAEGGLGKAARWTGLALLIGGGLAGISRPETPILGTLARPFTFLVSLFTGGDADPAGRFLDNVLPLAGRMLRGGVGTDLPGSSGIDLSVSLQILSTALVFGLALAVPVAIVTIWMLHSGSAGRGDGRS